MIIICQWILSKCSYYTMYSFGPYYCSVWCFAKVYLICFIAGLDAFRTFLKSEFSEENVEFWLACEDFKKTESAEKVASKAKRIYSEFIVADAPKEVSEALQDVEDSAPIGCVPIRSTFLKPIWRVIKSPLWFPMESISKLLKTRIL